MKLYFQNAKSMRLIAKPQTEEEAIKEIHAFCEERHFQIYYTRTWRDTDGFKWFDMGSHSEYFILDDLDDKV